MVECVYNYPNIVPAIKSKPANATNAFISFRTIAVRLIDDQVSMSMKIVIAKKSPGKRWDSICSKLI